MKKKLLATLLTVCMVLSMASTALAAGTVFTDVNADDWFAEEVEYVYDNGLMNGVGGNAFDPNGNVTRAMMWTTLARIAGVSTTGSDPWWLAGQQWAMKTGVSDGTGALDDVTREQLVTMLYRYAGSAKVTASQYALLASYPDADKVNDWAEDAMAWALTEGILNGMDGKLNPQGSATRAQLATILYRFVEDVADASSATYTVTFMWNYGNKGVYETVKVESGKTVGSLRNPSRSGYSFSGWYTEKGERFTLNTKVTEDIVVYAKWAENSYVPSHTHSWTAGTTVDPTCTSEGYTVYTCSCGESKNGDTVPAVNHVAGVKCPHCGVTEVETDEQLAKALTDNAESIHVILLNDINLPISSLGTITPGMGEYKLGGDNTTAITIDLNKHNLTLTTDYRTAIGAKNDEAIITIKNGVMNGIGNSQTTWEGVDLTFANCNYVFEDVTFEKEVALRNTGKTVIMNDVVINGTGDYYALWITAEGQIVNIDGLTVNSAGRGIKIDEQYVPAENLDEVTLTVSDAKFTTEKKAAIMVKSAAGAAITLSNVDISDVTDDTVNAVWVDEDSAKYQDLVTVTGGSKFLEGAVAKIDDMDDMFYGNLQAAVDAAVDGDTVTLLENVTEDVTVTQNADVKFTIDGNNKTLTGTITVDGQSKRYETAGVTIQNVNFEAESISADAYIRLGNGGNNTRYTNNVTVKDCTFSGTGIVAIKSYTGGDKNLTIEGCTVNEGMHSLLQVTNVEEGLKIVGCTVKSKNGANLNNTPSLEMSGCTFDVKGYAVRIGVAGSVNEEEKTFAIKNSTLKSACEDGDAIIIFRDSATYATLTLTNTTLTGTTQFKDNTDATTIIIDGAFFVADQNTLQAAITAGKTNIVLADDITVDKWIMFSETLTTSDGKIITVKMDGLTIDGNGHTLTVNSIESAGNGNRLFYDASNLNIHDLTIKYAEGLAGGIGLKSGVISNVNFVGGGYGILPGAGNIKVENCTFATNSDALYFENARDNLTVTGCTFNQPNEKNVILLRGNVKFTNNTVNSGRTVNIVSGSPVVTGNNFNNVRLKVYAAATATVSNNTINNLEFETTTCSSNFVDNTLSTAAQAALDAVTNN